jgi:ceramide glucosyltransferase
MITLIEGVLLVLIGGSIAFYLACAICTLRFFTTADSTIEPIFAPVSILVPVCGLEPGAWENWSSLCKQDYPDYEVLFGVVDPADSAVPLLKQLAEMLPDRVRLFTGLTPRGINHKDSTLSYLLEAIQSEIVIFVDSDICVSSDYIRTVTAPLADPTVGIVTCAYVAHAPAFVSSALASLGRCCDFIPSALIARVLDGGLRFAIGVTIATRKSSLANYGGLHLNRIGSDYNIGKRAARAGYRVELSHEVLESDTERESLAQLFQRELRWARTIRFNRGPVYYTLAFCYGTVYCLPLLVLAQFQPWAIAVALTTYAIRYAQAIVAISGVKAPKLIGWLWLLPFRDGFSFVVWAIGAFGRVVYWRGRHLRIRGDGLITQWE